LAEKVPLAKVALLHTGPLALVELQNGRPGAAKYVVGTENFYVITRYNWSSYYAMAVIELGQEITQAMNPQSPNLQPAVPVTLQ
jgi:membrane-bound lytic murein transglycosylase B